MHLAGDALVEVLEVSSGTLEHLLDCARCRSRVRELIDEEAMELLGVGRVADVLPGKILDRAAEVWAAGDQDREPKAAQARLLYDRLLGLPPKQRLEAVSVDPDFLSPDLVQLLLAAGEEATDPNLSYPMGLLALAIIDRLESPTLNVLASCLVAEAQRLRGNLEAANDFLESAAVEIQGEPLNSTVRARFCRTGAALRADQGRLDEALALLSRASSIYENHGAFEALTQTGLAEGLLFIEELEFEQAFRALRSALTLVDSTAQPLLTLAILQALALTCADLGRGESLAEVLETLDALGPLLPQPLGALRIAWTKAEVDWRLDETSTAIPRLRKIFSTLLKEAPAVEAATAALELARMQLHDPPGLANLQTLLFSLKPLALEGKLTPALWETLSFALGFVQLGEGYAGEVLDAAVRYLKRAQFNPELPFHPLDQPEALLSWNEVPEDLRTATAQAAGVELEDGEPESLQDRDLLAWTHEALHRVRVQFPDLGS